MLPRIFFYLTGIFFLIFRGRILKAIMKRNKILIKNIIVLLLNNFIGTNRKKKTKLYLLLVGPNKIVRQENNNILDEILVSLLDCFFKSAPWMQRFAGNFLDFTVVFLLIS